MEEGREGGKKERVSDAKMIGEEKKYEFSTWFSSFAVFWYFVFLIAFL